MLALIEAEAGDGSLETMLTEIVKLQAVPVIDPPSVTSPEGGGRLAAVCRVELAHLTGQRNVHAVAADHDGDRAEGDWRGGHIDAPVVWASVM